MPTDATVSDPAGLGSAAANSGAERRGPLRPRALVTARARRAALLQLDVLKLADRVVLFALAVLVAAQAADRPALDLPLGQVAAFLLAPLVAAAALAQLGLYRFQGSERTGGRLLRLLTALALAWAVSAVAGWMAGVLGRIGRPLLLWAATAGLGCGVLHLLAAKELSAWRRSGRLKPNIVIVGATAHAERLIRAALARQDLHVIGVFDDRLARAPDSVEGVPVLGDVDALIGHGVLPHVDHVVVAVEPGARARELAARLAVLPNAVSLLVDGDRQGDAALARIAGEALLRLSGPPEDRRRLLAKRMLDLMVSAGALVALAPLLALIALAVKLDSPGPVFFRQRRHGFNNEAITVWKFRSMRHAAADATASRQVSAGDPRVTRLGRFLRASSLDELPQLINVLSGEMSLVGPRPHAIGMRTGEEESEKLVAEYAWRHRIKPGLTGWAAINGSRGPLHTAEAVRERVALDLEYVERQSFWLDVWIMLMTAPRLLGDRAAVR